MAKPPYVPDWVDDRTAEWCADLCDAMAARLLAHLRSEPGAYLGAEVSATCIRELLKGSRAQTLRGHQPDNAAAGAGSYGVRIAVSRAAVMIPKLTSWSMRVLTPAAVRSTCPPAIHRIN